jgi:hypothetical protein
MDIFRNQLIEPVVHTMRLTMSFKHGSFVRKITVVIAAAGNA